MSDFRKKKYTLAEPGCGITVLSMEGSEINLFGSRTVIKTSEEDFFEPIQDFLHEKFVEEKADTMYYIGVARTAVLGVLAGVAIVGGVIATITSGGGAAPLIGLGFALGGSAIASYDYTFNTLERDRVIGVDRSWMQFYVESTLKEGIGAVTGGLVFVTLWQGGLAAIDAAGGLSSCIPAIVDATSGGAVLGAVGEEVAVGVSAAALAAAAFAVGKGGESKEGVEFEKNEQKTLDDILEDAELGRATKGKTTQYVKSGTYEQASEDFDALNPSNVREINTKFGSGKTGTLSDGRTITARPGSSEGRPTLEIRSSNGRGIEIRYGK